jgi:hypothetical protein
LIMSVMFLHLLKKVIFGCFFAHFVILWKSILIQFQLLGYIGDRKWEAGATYCSYSGEIQCDMEFSTSQGWFSWVLPQPTGSKELLLLQDSPEGRLHCWEPIHAWQVCSHWFSWGSIGYSYPNES